MNKYGIKIPNKINKVYSSKKELFEDLGISVSEKNNINIKKEESASLGSFECF